MNTTETREKHLQWRKQRALQYVEQGDNVSACQLGFMLLLGGHIYYLFSMETKEQGRDFINGFN